MFSFGCEPVYRAHDSKEIGMAAKKLCLYQTTIIPKKKGTRFRKFSATNRHNPPLSPICPFTQTSAISTRKTVYHSRDVSEQRKLQVSVIAR